MSNAIELLQEDHRKMKDLLSQAEETSEDAVEQREQLLREIKLEMSVHEQIEEQVLYPALKKHEEIKEIVLESYEEHHVVDHILSELDDVPVDDEKWQAKFKVMKENIEHHIEEEEGELFKKAADIFSEGELDELGRVMERMKKEMGKF